MKNATVASSEEVDGETCDRLCKVAGSDQSEYWISKSRSVIRRIQDKKTIGPNMTATVSKDKVQIESFAGLLSYLIIKAAGTVSSKMQPMPTTTNTFYRTVVIDDELLDSVFSEQGRAD